MNQLYFGDCLDVLKELHKKHPEGFIDLVYIDPPFNSKRNYNILFESIDLKDTKAQREAFADTWSNVSYHDTLEEIHSLDLDLYKFLIALDSIRLSKSAVSYLTTMAIRIWYIHKVLKNTASFFLHCDPTMSHYLKLVCDLVFGKDKFRNEIIWCYTRPGTKHQKQFSRVHDTIFFFSKSDSWIFNGDAVRIPYAESTIKRGDYSVATSKMTPGVDERILPSGGKVPEDWWKIPMIQGNSNERLNYPTQKPEALLERIIKASSNEGDLVADFFCGCGTTIAAAQKLNRRWLGADISHLAIKLVLKRLTDPYPEEKRKEILKDIEVNGFPKDIASAKELSLTDKGRIKFQDWIIEVMIGGVSNQKKSGDGGYDGYFTFSKSVDGKSKGTGIIEVKSGNVGIATLKSFFETVNQQQADMGIFVCFEEQVTKGMRIAASSQGKIPGFNNDKLQILTVEDLMNGKRVNLPGLSEMSHFESSTKKLDKENKEEGMF